MIRGRGCAQLRDFACPRNLTSQAFTSYIMLYIRDYQRLSYKQGDTLHMRALGILESLPSAHAQSQKAMTAMRPSTYYLTR